MPLRYFLSSSARDSMFGILSDTASLERFYVLAEEDLVLVLARLKPENRLGMAIHNALLRYPGQGWRKGDAAAVQATGHSRVVGLENLDLCRYVESEIGRLWPAPVRF